jgi:hypothetical protein
MSDNFTFGKSTFRKGGAKSESFFALLFLKVDFALLFLKVDFALLFLKVDFALLFFKSRFGSTFFKGGRRVEVDSA